jgi:hypothetical protein
MFRFTIRELVLLTLVVALGVGWWLDRSKLLTVAVDANAKAAEIDLERANWELLTQHEAFAHKETLRVIEQSGLRIEGKNNKLWLVKVRAPDPGFDIVQPSTLNQP